MNPVLPVELVHLLDYSLPKMDDLLFRVFTSGCAVQDLIEGFMQRLNVTKCLITGA